MAQVRSGRAFGYLRGSLDRQTLTLEAQRLRISAYAVTQDLGEVLFFSDPGVSASKVAFADREAGAALIAVLRPGDHIVITNIDRAFRNLVDCLTWFETWIERDIFLHVVNFQGNTIDPRTSIGRLVFRTIASLAEFESDLRGERVRATLEHLKSQGRWQAGWAPMGFKIVKDGGKGQGRLEPCARSRKIMGHVLDVVEQSPNVMAASVVLNREKYPYLHPQQERWNREHIYRICKVERGLRAKERGETA